MYLLLIIGTYFWHNNCKSPLLGCTELILSSFSGGIVSLSISLDITGLSSWHEMTHKCELHFLIAFTGDKLYWISLTWLILTWILMSTVSTHFWFLKLHFINGFIWIMKAIGPSSLPFWFLDLLLYLPYYLEPEVIPMVPSQCSLSQSAATLDCTAVFRAWATTGTNVG